MKVRVSFTVDADDDLRRAISDWYGREDLATRDEIRAWYEANGRSMDMDLLRDDDEAGDALGQWSATRGPA